MQNILMFLTKRPTPEALDSVLEVISKCLTC